jgi:hypothetical protein
VSGVDGSRRTLWVALVVAGVLLVAGVGAAVYFATGGSTPGTGAADTVGAQQSLAVAAFIKAYVKDDAATMEKLVTPRNIPWDAPPPALPPGVSTDTVASFIDPYRAGPEVVIGNPLVVEVRMTGDGREPTGTVTAVISTRKQPTRTVEVGVVLASGRWLLDTIDGRPVVDSVHSLAE